MSANAEARLHQRVSFREDVNVVASASSPPLRLRALNLSDGGLCLQTTHPFRRGDRVGLRLRAAGVDLAVPVAEVAWVVREVKGSSRIPAVGLRFTNLRPPQRQALKQALAALQNAFSLPPLASAQSANALASPAPNPPPPQRPAPTPAAAPAAAAPLHRKGPSAMHAEPSLPPLAGISTVPPPSVAVSDSMMTDAGPSLGPLSRPPQPSAEWSFSNDTSGRPTRAPMASPSMALAGGLLVVGTLAGVVFGVLDQRGPTEPARVTPAVAPAAEGALAAPTLEAPTDPAPMAAAAPSTARPTAASVAASAPTVAPTPLAVAAPAPAPAPVAAPAASVRAAAPVAPTRAVAPVAPRDREKPALPSVRPGQITLGTLAVVGKELVLPIRGVRKVERTFVLQKPDRVVVDLDGDAFGTSEAAGRGRVLKVRMGKRDHGVRLVLDVKDAAVARSARVERRQGVTTVVFPLK